MKKAIRKKPSKPEGPVAKPKEPTAPKVSKEPMFTLRAQDLLAPDTLRFWADRMKMSGANSVKAQGARDIAAAMEAWPGSKKLPD